VRHLHRLAAGRDLVDAPDQQLLETFAARHEEAAFAALVKRHGPMVLGVCRRVLSNDQDAEDAFQATFLTLARKASSIRKQASVGSWLHGVARRIAAKTRQQQTARHRRELHAAPSPSADPLAEVTARELLMAFDEELAKLPERERAVLVLCYLEGMTRDQAARRLRCSLSTANRLLDKGKDRMRARLNARGLALPGALLAAGLAASVVPPALAASATQAATKAIVLSALTGAAKVKTAVAVVLAAGLAVGVGLLAGRAPALSGAAEGGPQAVAPVPKDKSTLQQPDPAGGAKECIVSGRVIDPSGQPVAGAEMALMARQGLMLSGWQGWTRFRNDLVRRIKTDHDGRFRLAAPRIELDMTMRQLRVAALAPGFGIAFGLVDPDAKEAIVELRLTRLQPVRGHLIGIQGEPAAGVTVHVVRLSRPAVPGEPAGEVTLRPPEALGLAAMTDAKGDFAFQNLGPGLTVEMEIRDPRYKRKEDWIVQTADSKECEHLKLVLAPGRSVEGRVVYDDTGAPVPHARLEVANPIVNATADDKGRFQISVLPGDKDLAVHAYPHPGDPYLNTHVGASFPPGVVHRQVEIRLPRGVLVRGKVTEVAGKPVAGAYVCAGEYSQIHAVTNADGSFQLGVAAGKGRIYVTHPNDEFIPVTVGSGGGSLNKPIGDPSYYHGVVELETKPGDKEAEVHVQLRRGVTVKGRLLGPDGKPVTHAVLFVSAHKPRHEKTMHPSEVRDGTFEVLGLDPEKKYRLLFLDHPDAVRLFMSVEAIPSYGQLWLRPLLGTQNKNGAVVEVNPKEVCQELLVHLAPCGKARVRFVDSVGKPLAKYAPWLQMVVTPGPAAYKAVEDKTLAAEVITLTGRYGGFGGEGNDIRTDAGGWATFEGLIPGVTYRIKKTRVEPRNEVLKDFTTEAGKTAELTITVDGQVMP
jgi:RNA polymerase sigma factor (sigma-70 family)